MKKRTPFIKTFVLSLTLLICTVGFISCAGHGAKKVALSNYIHVTFDENAYNGYASPKLEIDTDGLNASADEEALYNFYKENAFWLGGGDSVLENLIDIDLEEKYSKLSNGDKIYITVKPVADLELCGITTMDQLAKEINAQFSSDRIEITVKGLQEPQKQTVDINKLISVDFGKYNGYATPSISINQEYLSSLVNQSVYTDFVNAFSAKIAAALQKYPKYTGLFEIRFAEAYNNISNGDTVKVIISPNQELVSCGITADTLADGLMLKFDTFGIEYTVSGLEKADKVIDLFQDIEECITFKGPNGKGTVSLKLTSDFNFVVGDFYFNEYEGYGDDNDQMTVIYNNEVFEQIYYRIDIDKQHQLDKGEVITIVADVDETLFEEYGYIIASKTYDLTVPDMGEYLTEDDILSTEIVNNLTEYLIKTTTDDVTVTKACHELYFGTINPGVQNKYAAKTAIAGVIQTYNGWWGTQYSLVYLYDIVVEPDGTIQYSEIDYEFWHDSVEKASADLRTDYTFTKLK